MDTSKITIKEVKVTIKTLKNINAAGLNEIPTEVLKHGAQAISKNLTMLFKKCWQTEKSQKTSEEVR